MWWRRRSAAVTMVRDCEAFLAGEYVERAEHASGGLPAWAWLNLLAHGSHDQLVEATARLGAVDADEWRDRRWRNAQGYLAGELLDACNGEPAALRDLQRRVLVPLELDLTSAVTRLDPAGLAKAVLDALERDAARSRRPSGAARPRQIT